MDLALYEATLGAKACISGIVSNINAHSIEWHFQHHLVHIFSFARRRRDIPQRNLSPHRVRMQIENDLMFSFSKR